MKFVIVGGGIAGVSCASQLSQVKSSNDEITLISGSRLVKTIVNWHQIGQFTEFFNIESRDALADKNIQIVFNEVVDWNSSKKLLYLKDASTISYDRLCIASGAVPREIPSSKRHIVIRDTDSVADFVEKLSSSKRVAVIGNGGISTELIYELKNCHISWVIKDETASATWFIPQVEKFFLNRINEGRLLGHKNSGIIKRNQFQLASGPPGNVHGGALGPDWNTVCDLSCAGESRKLDIIRNSFVESIENFEDKVILKTNQNVVIECDLVIWATGVVPDSSLWAKDPKITRAVDKGLLVNERMMTTVEDVYACGDVCTVSWSNHSDVWKQMRLWTQARQMGAFCAKSMFYKDQDFDLDFVFELFSHVTTFFGWKVVLLGDFKAEYQKQWYTRERQLDEEQYVCCILSNHRVVGAVLIGETNLEETVENLILNRTNLQSIEDRFLDPEIDIEDYFD